MTRPISHLEGKLVYLSGRHKEYDSEGRGLLVACRVWELTQDTDVLTDPPIKFDHLWVDCSGVDGDSLLQRSYTAGRVVKYQRADWTTDYGIEILPSSEFFCFDELGIALNEAIKEKDVAATDLWARRLIATYDYITGIGLVPTSFINPLGRLLRVSRQIIGLTSTRSCQKRIKAKLNRESKKMPPCRRGFGVAAS